MKHRGGSDMNKAERGKEDSSASPPPPSTATSPTPSSSSSAHGVKLRDYRSEMPAETWAELPARDKTNVVALVIMYFLQGVPLGLVSGSLPFILKDRFSYADLATFSLALYPYSLKLLWSPVVDAVFWPALGRRKTWIVPTQLALALFFWWNSFSVEEILQGGSVHVGAFSLSMFLVILLAATQDIAVDGWALTLLSKPNLSWASTCQSIGLQIGFFVSYTVFLALNSADFCNQFLFSEPRAQGLLSMGAFMRGCALAFVLFTLWLLFRKKEDPSSDSGTDGSVREAYGRMVQVLQLPNVKRLAAVLLVMKIGFIAGESIAPLKIIDKGFRKDRLALAAVIDFPIQIYLGLMAARWCTGDRPLGPFVKAVTARLLLGVVGMLLVHIYPGEQGDAWYFPSLLAASVAGSFTSTVMFVCVGAFFARISDPVIGGTYLTLLNTLANFGGTWPKWLVLRAVDSLAITSCTTPGSDCVGEACERTCTVVVDGYYVITTLSILIGLAVHWVFVAPTLTRLQAAPERSWRV